MTYLTQKRLKDIKDRPISNIWTKNQKVSFVFISEVNGNSFRSSMRQSSSSSSIGHPHNNHNNNSNHMQTVASQVVAYHFCQADNAPTW
jgi:hypothetical protein